MRNFFASIVIAAAVACASAPPQWIESGEEPAFPAPRYWSAVGEGEDEKSSERRARIAITRRLETRLGAPDDGVEVSIADRWRDPANEVHLALAVLDVDEAAARYRARAIDEARSAVEWTTRARTAAAPLHAVPHWLEALAASRARDDFSRRAAALGASPGSSEGSVSTAEIDAEFAGVLEALRFEVGAFETGLEGRLRLPELESDVIALFAERDFSSGSSPGPVIVTCRVQLVSVEPDDPLWSHYRWDGGCSVSRRGALWIAAARAGGESHPSAEVARLRVREAARRVLIAALRERVERAFDADE